MGQLFRRSYRAADGTVRTCETWTLRYYRNGKPIQESTQYGKGEKGKAQQLLKRREGDIAKGMPVSPASFKLTFDDAAKDVINDFKANGKRSLAVVERRINKHLLPYFRGFRMAEITDDRVRAYIAHRQAQTITIRKERVAVGPDGRLRREPEQTKAVSNAEINRELQILKRAYSLNRQKLLGAPPSIPKLRESAPRSGFFERAEFDSVQSHLPEPLRGLVHFAFITGWRVPSEVQTLEWRQVDLSAGTIRLDPGQTKNGEARTFPVPADGSPLILELRQVLEAQRAYTDIVQKKKKQVVPYVFHRNGKPITAFTKAWKLACLLAGCPGRIPHDFRRTAVRNLVRSGIPERVAMQMTGHRTPSVFARYNIVNEADLFDAARRYQTPHRDSFGTVAHPSSVAALANNRKH